MWIFPVTTKIELAEKEKLERARERVAITFSRFLWHLPAAFASEHYLYIKQNPQSLR
jgi:hypothetical protein